jgi:hypothetical protein
MSGSQQFQRAMMLPLDATNGTPDLSGQMEVHFNPETLRIQRSNNLQADTKASGRVSQPAQLVDTGAARLTLDLLFDTTLQYQPNKTDADVRLRTKRLVELYIRPAPKQNAKPPPARSMLFVWGTFRFNGLVESMTETLDFFAEAGVPLRASVSLTLAENRYDDKKLSKWAPPPPRALNTPLDTPLASSMQAAGLDPSKWRSQAMRNGLETPRFTGGPLATGGGSGTSGNLGSNIPGAFGPAPDPFELE